MLEKFNNTLWYGWSHYVIEKLLQHSSRIKLLCAVLSYDCHNKNAILISSFCVGTGCVFCDDCDNKNDMLHNEQKMIKELNIFSLTLFYLTEYFGERVMNFCDIKKYKLCIWNFLYLKMNDFTFQPRVGCSANDSLIND